MYRNQLNVMKNRVYFNKLINTYYSLYTLTSFLSVSLKHTHTHTRQKEKNKQIEKETDKTKEKKRETQKQTKTWKRIKTTY